jgi:hypothetical protein
MTEAIYAHAAKLASASATDGRQPNESAVAREVGKLRYRARVGDVTSAEQRLVAKDATRPERLPAPLPPPPPDEISTPDAIDLDVVSPTRRQRTQWDLDGPMTPFDPRAEEWK